MKLLLNFNGKPDQKPYKHALQVSVPQNSISFLGVTHKSIESWFEAVRRKLLSAGISDFQCHYLPLKEDSSLFQIRFYFQKELDKLQFMAIVFDDIKGVFNRVVSSKTKENSKARLKNIESFLNANDMSHQIMEIDDLRFKVVTYSRFDDLAIATHYLNGFFDKGIESLPSPIALRELSKS